MMMTKMMMITKIRIQVLLYLAKIQANTDTENIITKFRINVCLWEKTHLPLPKPNISTNFSLWAKC